MLAVLLLVVGSVSENWNITTATCFWTGDKASSYIEEGINTAGTAWATYNHSLFADGWYRLNVKGNDTYSDEAVMFCGGMVEGYLTFQGMFNHFNLIKDIKGYERGHFYPPEVHDYIYENLQYTRTSVAAYTEDPFWQEIGMIISQFDGLVAGYKNRTQGTEMEMTLFDHWFFQSAGDMFDIAALFPGAKADAEYHEHCSGMVKLTDDYKDIYFAHDAWSDYRELHGQLKEYDLPVRLFKAGRLVMSTRIGKLASYDDFYMSDAGLFVLETTLNNYNQALYDVCTPKSLFTWLRAVHATWTSDSGREWAETFIRHNSGTYNNQYVIVDSKKLVRGEKPTTDLLWIIEQFPGTYDMTDVTSTLVNDGYFPSVNTPWHERLYNLAGYPELVAAGGIYGAYRSNRGPRWQIMMRDAPRIKSFDDFKAFMRYNQYYRDNFSQGDPAQQILARYDLRPPTTPYGDGHAFGGLDAKCLRLTEAVTSMSMHAYASPAYESQSEDAIIKPWEFGVAPYADIKYDGLPQRWNFSWSTFGSDRGHVCAGYVNEKDCTEQDDWCGWCTYTQTCMVGDSSGALFETCDSGWRRKTVLASYAIPMICVVSVTSVIFVCTVFGLHFYKRYVDPKW